MIANENNYPQIGTLGCKVIDRDSGDHLILSNWHVLYGRSDASNGEAVLQPSGKSNVIGHTIKGVINSRVDCAVASLDGIRGIDDGLLEIQGQVNGSADAYVGMKVIKSGLTGIAKGIVDGRTDITLHSVFSNSTINGTSLPGTETIFWWMKEIQDRSGSQKTTMRS